MSRSYKKPVTSTLFRGTVNFVDDAAIKEWKKEYNRAMRRAGNQDVKGLEKLDKEGIADNEYSLESKPGKTTHGNVWSGPTDGWTLRDSKNSWDKEYHYRMK
jgi:hypothetical protein